MSREIRIKDIDNIPNLRRGDRVRIRWFECYGRWPDRGDPVDHVGGVLKEVEGVVDYIGSYEYGGPLRVGLEGDSNHFELANVIERWPVSESASAGEWASCTGSLP